MGMFAWGVMVNPTGVEMSASSVGEAREVLVGSGVSVGASVGGTAVAVGMAACVSATIVKAAASAVCCTSTGLTVAVAWAPQALTNKLNTTPMINAFRFML